MRQHLPPLIKKNNTNLSDNPLYGDHCRLTVVDPAFVIPDRPRRHCQPFDDTFILTKYRRVRIACLVKSDHRSGTIHAAWVHLTKENMSLKRMHNKETKINVPV